MAAKYCLKCGYENDEDGGACLMCYAPLPLAAAAGQPLVLPEGVAPPPSPDAMAAAIVDAAGEGFAASAGAELDSDYAIAGVDEVGMDDLGGFGEMAARTVLPAAVAAEPVPGQATEAEEEFVPSSPPPGAVDLEQEPPPPPAPEPVAKPAPDLVGAEAVESEAMAEPPPPPPPGVVEPDEEPAEEATEERPASDWFVGD